jgi:hypothetical protein
MNFPSDPGRPGRGVAFMRYSKTMIIVRQAYDLVEYALWAGIAAFVIYFLIYIAPNVPEIARRAEVIRAMKNAEENRAYCEKWGLKRRTQEHVLCTMDLQNLRKKIEQDFADSSFP